MQDFCFTLISEGGARVRDWSRGRFQSIRTAGLLLGFLPTLCLSQIVTRAEFDFEKLSWGDSLSNVKKILHGRVLKEQSSEDQLGAVGAAMPSSILLSYEDTLRNNPCRVVLWFSKVEQKLTRVIVGLIHSTSSEQKGKPDEDALQSSAWEKFSERYGSPYVEGSIPFVGKSRTWSFRGTEVFMLSVNSFGKKTFTITYSPNRKK
jgi:hypothetical protein